jgi:hypothetical protein
MDEGVCRGSGEGGREEEKMERAVVSGKLRRTGDERTNRSYVAHAHAQNTRNR